MEDSGNISLLTKIADNLPSGQEDTFTAILATVIEFVPQLGDLLLDWVRQSTGAEIPPGKYCFRGQTPTAQSTLGASNIDMTCRGEHGVEVWFEHKLGSKENRYGTDGDQFGQIAKYVESARQAVAKGDGHTLPIMEQVWIVYVCRERERIRDWESLPSHNSQPVALANIEGWALRWRDLYDRVAGLQDQGGLDVDQLRLMRQFVHYWDGLHGMRVVERIGTWAPGAKALKANEELKSWYSELWCFVAETLGQWIPGRDRQVSPLVHSHGAAMHYETASEALPVIRVTPKWADKARASRTGDKVLDIQISLAGDDVLPPLPSGFQTVGKPTSRSNNRMVHSILVEMSGWKDNVGPEEMAEAIIAVLSPLCEALTSIVAATPPPCTPTPG